MPSPAKPRKSANGRAASSRKGNSAKKTSASSRARSASASTRSRATSAKGRASATTRPVGDPVESLTGKARKGALTAVKGAAAATVATAAAALAGRALISSRRRKRVLGVPMPRKRPNVKSAAKQFSGLAGELEKKSLDVSKASGRLKQAANTLS